MSPEEEGYRQKIEIALATCKEKRKEEPDFVPLELAEEQLIYLRDYLLGRVSDVSLLANMNIGLLTVREFEVRDMAFSEQIYEALGAQKYLLTRHKT